MATFLKLDLEAPDSPFVFTMCQGEDGTTSDARNSSEEGADSGRSMEPICRITVFLNGIKYRLLCVGACFERDNVAVSKISKSSHTHTHKQTTTVTPLRMR